MVTRAGRLLTAVFVMLAVAAPVATVGPIVVEAAPQVTSRYAPISPVRVVDTRQGVGGAPFAAGAVQALQVVTAEVAARAGVAPEAVTAAVLNVTITQAEGPGHVTVWADGDDQPVASSLNAEYPGHTIANLVTTPVGNTRIKVFAHTGLHLVVDVQGVYVAADSATAGRLVPLVPRRVLDTRMQSNPWRTNEVRTVDLRPNGVPESAVAAVVNLTTTQTTAAGYFTVFPSGPTPPVVSNLNMDGPGQTIANQAMATLASGRMQVYASATAHLVIDLVGYITGPSAPAGSDGLFVPAPPYRLLDTRLTSRPPNGSTLTVQPLGQPGIPAGGVSAVALNVTLTQTSAPGHATAWPANLGRPATSTVNAARANQTIANHATTPIGPNGFAIFNFAATHILADVTGYWTGAPAGPPTTGTHAFAYPRGTRWDPCKPIRYVVNMERQTSPAQREALDYALVRAAAATGLQFQYVGDVGGLVGADRRPPAGAEAVLAVFTANEVSALSGSVVGLGGGSYSISGGVGTVNSGFAFLDQEVSDPAVMRKVWLHEIGHLIGLGHVADNAQVMAQGGFPPLQEYGNGDLEGFWWLGAAQGCVGAADVFPESAPSTGEVVFVD